jgi:pimeloyl-ACP methyl ester carboxylesterase
MALRRFAVATVLLAATVVAGQPGASAAATRHVQVVESRSVVDVPVAFRVRNLNRSELPCPTDGGEYTLRGRLVGPRSAFAEGRHLSGTLYLHEFAFGQFFWRFPIREYDFVTPQARDGHVSVIVDRLGYDESPGPDGYSICFGSQADMAHQVVEQLRAGTYSASGMAPAPFRRLALAGHSVGGLAGELAAYSFGGIDAFLLLSWADQGFSSYITTETVESGAVCARGGEEAHPGGPRGYAYVGQTADDFRTVFADYDERVFERALELRNRDPCGDIGSLATATQLNQRRVGDIDVPVFMLHGLDDVVFEDPRAAGAEQERLYAGAPEITHVYPERTGHEFTLGRTAPEIRAVIARWLRRHGF